jgi:glycogen debranching enzyme
MLAHVRPELRFAWRGTSLLVTDLDAGCDSQAPLSGWYYREARHLSRLQLLVNGQPPWRCEVATPDPTHVDLSAIHPELTEFGGGGTGVSGAESSRDPHGLLHRTLELLQRCTVTADALTVTVRVKNRARESAQFHIGWKLAADFADLQEAMGGKRRQEAPVAIVVAPEVLTFIYEHPQLPLQTVITPDADHAWQMTRDSLTTHLTLLPCEEATLTLHVTARGLTAAEALAREIALAQWQESITRAELPATLASAWDDNLSDLQALPLLDGAPDEWLTLQAGVPAYPAIFGRDALTAGWQSALLDRGAMLQAALRRLGRLQADRDDAWRDAQPGRLPYQIRQGPLARLGLDPYDAYYADFASPLMFVISLAHLYAWQGDRAAVREHWDTVRRILDWARTQGDRDGDGYLEYLTVSSRGTRNQGWKDSGDAIVDERGEVVPVPLGTCELQGYWFAAQQLAAVLAMVLGDEGEARALWRASADLKERFNRDWWLPQERCVALCLGPDKRPVATPTSNMGHCLASGIIAAEHVAPLVGRLFTPDLFSGWGIRTLSTEHPSYHPLSYHCGTVWPVENATIAFGLRRLGHDLRAQELALALFDLAHLYENHRMPECVGGYARGERSTPSAYPRANPVQAWNASALPLCLHALLGLQPLAPLGLLVVDPALPTWMPEVTLRGLRVGEATADVHFWRDPHGRSHAELQRVEGNLRLLRQPPPEAPVTVAERLRALLDGALH